jgi:formylglycine-generating enzyme required for sulfatase activity
MTQGFKCWGPGDAWSERQDRSWRNPGFPQSSSHPVVCLSFNDAIAYVGLMTRKTGKAYRLLAESEWEYSARARTEPGDYPRYFFGDDESDLCRYGNVLDQTKRSEVIGIKGLKFVQCKTGFAYTSPAGSFAPNGFGLFDMEGNAWTWTEDCYHDNYIGVPTDGAARTSGDCNNRVLRGASWVDNSTFLRAAKRFPWYSIGRASNVGFRVERVLSR